MEPAGADPESAQGTALASARAVQRAEVVEAARRLGLDPADIRWIGLAAGTVGAHEDQVCGVISELLTELRPDETYVTCADDPLPDHAATGRAAYRAVATTGGANQLLEYPVWLWTAWPMRRGAVLGSTGSALRRLVRRGAVAVTSGEQLTPKWHALQAYVQQLHRPRGLPVDEPWPGALPVPVLAAAADRAEIFFPVRPDDLRRYG